MYFLNILSIATLASIIFGQLVRIIVLPGGVISITDIFIFFLLIYFFTYFVISKKSIKFPTKIGPFIIIFIIAAAASTLLSSNKLPLSQVFISSLFLLRFIIYFCFLVVFFNLYKKKHIENLMNAFLTIGLIFSILGLFQFIFFPNLIFLQEYGWDPHYFRLVSTFLDPNFSGIFLTILFAFSLSLYIFQKKILYLIYLTVFFVSLTLTFSRSTYLALVVLLLVVGVLKSSKVALALIIIFILMILFIPKVRIRIEGALNVDETSAARIQSWRKATEIIKDNYLFGIGFNTYRYTQKSYNFFTPDAPQGNHSGAGTDSSLLFVLATTGIIGTVFYLTFIAQATKLALSKIGSSPLHLATISSVAALLVHSQFSNSLFFPPIMLTLWFIFSLIEIDAT